MSQMRSWLFQVGSAMKTAAGRRSWAQNKAARWLAPVPEMVWTLRIEPERANGPKHRCFASCRKRSEP